MDSLSQAVLGASVAGVCAPAGHRRRALAAGAMLGTLPDLDVLIDYGDAVRNFTYHRGFSHSLLVLAPFSVGLWLLLRRWWSPVRAAPLHWLAAISLALLTHPLLDAHTAYGTQLFWPLTTPPKMWATLFIIDPAYTLPLLVGTVVAAARPRGAWRLRALRAGLCGQAQRRRGRIHRHDRLTRTDLNEIKVDDAFVRRTFGAQMAAKQAEARHGK